MGQRQKQWARRRRQHLLLMLGGRCRTCGTREALTFDLISPGGDQHHRMEASTRCSFYSAEMRRGNLQILCAVCNSIKGGISRELYRAALRAMYLSEHGRAGEGTPARGNALTALERQDMFRRAVASLGTQLQEALPF